MNKGVTLRNVKHDDDGFLFLVYAATRDEELAQTGWNEAEKRTFLEMQFKAQHADYTSRFPDAEYAVILQNDTPAGRLWVNRAPDEIRILDIALLPDYRNKGIGTVLLKRLQDEAKASGRPLRHSVFIMNEGALRFYKRLGFKIIENLEMYYLMEWTVNRPV